MKKVLIVTDGQPEQVAQSDLLLLPEQASYFTAIFIDLAGGR